VGFSADNKKIITVSYDADSYDADFELVYQRRETHNFGTLKIWDLETNACETKEISRDRMISACSIVGDHILFGHTDGSIEHMRFSPMVRKIEQDDNTGLIQCDMMMKLQH
jgi:hypothetical protein